VENGRKKLAEMQIRVVVGRLIHARIDIGLWWKYDIGSERRMRSVRLGKKKLDSQDILAYLFSVQMKIAKKSRQPII
jgi:hypothetical protein